MSKSLTRSEFEQRLHTHIEVIAESRVTRLMALPLPELKLSPADVSQREDGALSLDPNRLRAYIGLVAGEVLASFDEALLDVVYAEDAPSP